MNFELGETAIKGTIVAAGGIKPFLGVADLLFEFANSPREIGVFTENALHAVFRQVGFEVANSAQKRLIPIGGVGVGV